MGKTKREKQGDLKTCTLYVEGMHCTSCEVLIEQKLLQLEGVEAVDAAQSNGKVQIQYSEERPEISKLNNEFKELGYTFSEHKVNRKKEASLLSFSKNGELLLNAEKFKKISISFGVALVLVLGFFLLEGSGIASMVTVDASSSLLAFFLLGLVAGSSSCAALVGGVLLSMAKKWNEVYIAEESTLKRSQPHIMFHIGRLLSFALLGGVLGLVGQALTISTEVSAVITIIISLLMLILGLQMLEVDWAKKIRFTLPKSFGSFIANDRNFRGRAMPFLIGAATFFLPCGFTLVAQGLALSSGTFLSGALIMVFFALGTLPVLTVISISSIKLNSRPYLTGWFNRVAGLLVLFFALYNFNAQLNVLGVPSLTDLTRGQTSAITAESVDGIQVIKMQASSYAYIPDSFTIKANVPVRWEIEDIGTSGCTNALMARGLFDGLFGLQPGMNIIEFTPKTPGTYKFSCSMGMVSGVIEVV